VLVIVDVQGKLAELMHDRERLYKNLSILIQGIQAMEIPVLWLEQYPKGLGPTIPEVADLLPDQSPIAKTCFSGCGQPDFVEALRAVGRKQVLVAGIEAHICVYQTVRDLLESGYDVEVAADAVSSRVPENRQIALDKMVRAGAELTSVEMALYELLREAGTPAFKKILPLVQ
jgi:isochorismate hydrolase